MSDPRPLMVRHSIPDDADFVHEVHIGKLVQVRRERRQMGASVVDMEKFQKALAENNPPPLESWPAFLGGLVIGASVALTLVIIIGYCAWLAA